MGLINLKTNLKSLKYGQDTLGGGSSGQPYVQNSIPEGFNDLGPRQDFILRGGATTAKSTAEDIKRLTKMFADTKSPSGVLFVAKQQLLSRTAPRTQTSGILNEGTYLPLNTLTQAGVISIGGHLNRQGDPFSETGAYTNNENLYGVKVKSTQPIEENRLARLYELASSGTNGKLNEIILNDGVNVMTYTGGPSSDLGQGITNIRYSPISQTPLTKSPKSVNFTSTEYSLGQNDWIYSYELLSQEPTQVIERGISSPIIQDFRAILRENLTSINEKKRATDSGATPLSPNYSTQNYELRTNLGQPGQRANKSYANYVSGTIDLSTNKPLGPLDKINALSIYRSQNVTPQDTVNDLVKFRIAIIDNDSPNFKTFIHFRAFLDSMSDSYSATWNGFQYLGRSEQFYTYNGFTRQISLGWTVAAQSKQELIAMYKKLNYLASSLTGEYSPNGYMRGVLCQLTVGGYLYEQPGFITSLTYDIPNESPWEIAINTDGESDPSVKELPHIIKVTGFSFTPIQTFIPQLQNNSYNGGNSDGFVSSYGEQGGGGL